MEDAQIRLVDHPHRFRMCLTGEARDWYNDIVVPAHWDPAHFQQKALNYMEDA